MPTCSCPATSVLSNEDAQAYIDRCLIRIADHHGWTQLWKCVKCDTYWEKSYSGGGGFDEGTMTLRKLSPEELRERWPEVLLEG